MQAFVTCCYLASCSSSSITAPEPDNSPAYAPLFSIRINCMPCNSWLHPEVDILVDAVRGRGDLSQQHCASTCACSMARSDLLNDSCSVTLLAARCALALTTDKLFSGHYSFMSVQVKIRMALRTLEAPSVDLVRLLLCSSVLRQCFPGRHREFAA